MFLRVNLIEHAVLDPQRKRSGHHRASTTSAQALFPSSLPPFSKFRTAATPVSQPAAGMHSCESTSFPSARRALLATSLANVEAADGDRVSVSPSQGIAAELPFKAR
jgi:hypothetical protein